jgi:hypothetical protein
MQIADYQALRPFAYHLTARANLEGIERTSRLDPAALIIRRAQRTELLRTRRKDMTAVRVENDRVMIRDQAPLFAGNCDLPDGFSFEDLVELLNQFVYFWPGTDRGPNDYGKRHFARYAKIEDAVVLRIPTAELFAANAGLIPHASAFNSGSPRCNPQLGGRKSPRGPDTFIPFGTFAGTPSKVIELTYKSSVTLPWSAVEVSTPQQWI